MYMNNPTDIYVNKYIIIVILLILIILILNAGNDTISNELFVNSSSSLIAPSSLTDPSSITYTKCILTDYNDIKYELVLLSSLNNDIQKSILTLITNNIIINNKIKYNNLFTQKDSLININNSLSIDTDLTDNTSSEHNNYMDLLDFNYIVRNVNNNKNYFPPNDIIFAVNSIELQQTANIIKPKNPLLFDSNQNLYKTINNYIEPITNNKLLYYNNIIVAGDISSSKNKKLNNLYNFNFDSNKIKHTDNVNKLVFNYINLTQIGTSPIYLINLIDTDVSAGTGIKSCDFVSYQ